MSREFLREPRYALENSAEMDVSMVPGLPPRRAAPVETLTIGVDGCARALVSHGFSMHAECIGGETLFTSYANVGNPADWKPSMRSGAVTLRERRFRRPEREVYATRACRMWRTFVARDASLVVKTY